MAEINRALSRSRLLSPKQSGHLLYIIKGSYSEAYRPVRSMHCHDFLEVHYAAEGSSSCVIEQEAVVTEPGMLLIYNAGEFHAENPHRDSLSAFYSIAFDQIKMPDLPENHLIRPGHSHAIRLDRYESLFCALVNSCYYESKSREDRISPATRAMADLIL
ncbi:MAG: AraC family ligand binding domain-containing protein, partial [Eubacterium sp.]|nr:AraC family ligand binding domain-containing protein [Eubacterium sp.]